MDKNSTLNPNLSAELTGSQFGATSNPNIPGTLAAPATNPLTRSFIGSMGPLSRSPSCYQVPSLNETQAKKLCRKQPTRLIAYSRDHIVRTYPAGMRIDSSNFNPLMFWAFGIQMVALNYQTPDLAMALNTSMFEQSGSIGYQIKPRVMWDSSHPLYNRFNPWNKDFNGISAVHLTLTVISGQHVCMGSQASPAVEVELIGVPCDCAKEKTKAVQRNATNPIWNQKFTFRVNFLDMAFLRFSITDVSSGKIAGQRIIPLKHLRPGYRHVRLRSAQNFPLEFASIFIYSRLEEEEFIDLDNDAPEINQPRVHSLETGCHSPILKKQVFLVKLYGLSPDDSSVRVRIQGDTTVRAAVTEGLALASRSQDNSDDYIVIEELQSCDRAGTRSNSPRSTPFPTSHRMLHSDDKLLDAVATWNGAKGRFIVKKRGSDPSSRAWMTTIIKSGKDKAVKSSTEKQPESEAPEPANDEEGAWSTAPDATFLVCVHNVSPDQPYAILRAPLTSTAQDIVVQVLLKTRRLEDPSRYYLVEEQTILETDPSVPTSSTPLKSTLSIKGSKFGRSRTQVNVPTQTIRRSLRLDENIYQVQTGWKMTGRFLLECRDRAAEKKDSRRIRVGSVKSLSLVKVYRSMIRRSRDSSDTE